MFELFLKIASIIAPVLGMVLCGYIYARLRPHSARQEMVSVNQVIGGLLTPLMIFSAMSAKEFDIYTNWPLFLAGLWVIAGSILIGFIVARFMGFSIKTFVPPMMYNNCGNMGLPLALFAFGQLGFAQATVLFVLCNVLYFTLGAWILSGGKMSWQLLKTPIVGAMAFGLVFALLRIPVPEPIQHTLTFMSHTCITMMMISLGVRLMDVEFKEAKIGLIGGMVCPLSSLLFAYILLHYRFIPINNAQMSSLLLFASLPPGVFSYILADAYNQQPNKVAAIVLLGNLMSLIFVPLGLALAL
ncbi:MAG: AEC family transporter [Formosimonas sp.]